LFGFGGRHGGTASRLLSATRLSGILFNNRGSARIVGRVFLVFYFLGRFSRNIYLYGCL
jgi:hypothetical protein